MSAQLFDTYRDVFLEEGYPLHKGASTDLRRPYHWMLPRFYYEGDLLQASKRFQVPSMFDLNVDIGFLLAMVTMVGRPNETLYRSRIHLYSLSNIK